MEAAPLSIATFLPAPLHLTFPASGLLPSLLFPRLLVTSLGILLTLLSSTSSNLISEPTATSRPRLEGRVRILSSLLSSALDYSQTPFLPNNSSPPSPYHSPSQNSGSPQQHQQKQQQGGGSQFPMGFRRHRKKTSFKILFWGGMVFLIFGLVVSLAMIYLSWVSPAISGSDKR